MNRRPQAIPTEAITATLERISLLIRLVVLVPDLGIELCFDFMRRLPSLLTAIARARCQDDARFVRPGSLSFRVCLADRNRSDLRARTRRRCKCNENSQADEKAHREKYRDSFHGVDPPRMMHRKPTWWLRYRLAARGAR